MESGENMALLKEMLAAFANWQFIVACLAINAILITVTRMIKAAKPSLLKSGVFKGFVLTPMNLVLGLLIAIPPFLYGNTRTERLLVGLCAGFLSHFVYHTFKTVVKKLIGKYLSKDGDKKDEKKDQPADPNAPPVAPLPSGPTPNQQ